MIGDGISQRIGAYSAKPTAVRGRDARSEFAGFTGANVTLNCVNWGSPVVGTALDDHNTFCLSISLEGHAKTFDPDLGTIDPRIDEARVFCWQAGTQTVCSDSNTVINFSVPCDLLQHRVKTMYDNELNDALTFSPLLDLNSARAKPILSLIDHFKSLITETPEVLNNPLIATNLNETAVSIILSSLQHNYADRHLPIGNDVALRRVSLAEEYMRAHADQPITVETLAQHTNCGERALFAGFRRYRNATPMSVLRDIRLDNAYSDLQDGACSVTECAFKWGFSNLGRFSKLYSEKHGEKPSQTANSSGMHAIGKTVVGRR